MFKISASVTGAGMDTRIVCCFDPTVVVARLREALPEVEVTRQDFAWKDFDAFRARGEVEGAVRVAESDARRRGPIWAFRLPVPGRPPIRGRAERYDVSIWSDEPVPEPLRSRFVDFLQGLQFAPCVTIESTRLE